MFRTWDKPKFWAAMDEIHKPHLVFLKKKDQCSDGYVALKHSILWTIYVGPYFLGMVGSICRGYADGLRKELAVPIQTIITAAIFQSSFAIYLTLGDRFQKLLNSMNSLTDQVPDKISKTYVQLNRLTWLVYYVIMVFNVGSGAGNYWFEMHCEGRQRTGDKRYVCGQMSYFWFPFETEDGSLRKIVLTLYITGLQTYMIGFYSATMVAFLQIPLIISFRIEDVRKLLNTTKNKEALDKDDLRPLIKYYSQISGCVDEMNKSLGYSLISTCIFNTILIAILEYLCILEGSFENLMMLFFIILYQYFFCLLGQYLEDEHEELVECVTSLPWYKMSPQMKNNYKLFLGQVQIPFHLKIYPVVKINYQYLLAVLRGSYSLATFLMNSTKRK